MNTRAFSHTVVLIAVAMAIWSPSASATSLAPFDRSFGDRGTLNVRDYGSPGRTVMSCGLTKDGKLAIAGRFDPVTTLQSRWGRYNKLATTSVDLRSKRGGKNARWRRQPVSGVAPFAVENYRDGSFVSATALEISRAGAVFLLRKAHATGARDNRFGRRGARRLRINTPGVSSSFVSSRILAMSDGGVVVAYATNNGLYIARLDRFGSVASEWGEDGVVKSGFVLNGALPGAMRVPMDETRFGGLVVASRTHRGASLIRLHSNGAMDQTFGEDGHWYPPERSEPVPFGTAAPPAIAAVSSSDSGQTSVLVTNPFDTDVGVHSPLRAVQLSGSGSTIAVSPELLSYFNGGDTGFPDAYPLAFETTYAGVVFAFAETYYPGVSVRGVVVRWSSGLNLIAAEKLIGTHKIGFGIGDFAVADDGMSVLACGSSGTSKSGRPKSSRPKRIVVRSIGL